MEEYKEVFAMGKARVTAEGILFLGCRYGCRKALREQWYQRAEQEGEWDLAVMYDPKRPDVPRFIYINGDTDSPDQIGYPVKELQEDDNTERYHILFRQLLQELKALRR